LSSFNLFKAWFGSRSFSAKVRHYRRCHRHLLALFPRHFCHKANSALEKKERKMSRRSCYDLEVTNEVSFHHLKRECDKDIAARIASVPEPTDEDIVPKTSQFIRRKRNSFKSHITLSDRTDKYYSCSSVRSQLGRLGKI